MDTTIMQKAINTIAKRSNDEELRVCPHCGTKYAWFNKSTNSINIHVQVPACDCQERIEKEKEAAKIAEAKKEKLAKIFENSMMTPLFQEKVFSSLKETEHFDLCKKYAAEFNPKTAEGILMIGNVGTGKTTLLAAICNELMNKDFKSVFFRHFIISVSISICICIINNNIGLRTATIVRLQYFYLSTTVYAHNSIFYNLFSTVFTILSFFLYFLHLYSPFFIKSILLLRQFVNKNLQNSTFLIVCYSYL